MALTLLAQMQCAFNPRILLDVSSKLAEFYNMVCGNPPLVDLAKILRLDDGENCFGGSELKVGKFLNKNADTAVFVGFDFELLNESEYADYIFSVSIHKDYLVDNYQNGANGLDFKERADNWITIRMDPDTLKNKKAFESEVKKIVDMLLKK